MKDIVRRIGAVSLMIYIVTTSLLAQNADHVLINEIMQSNVDALMVKKDFPDSWIEFYNPTQKTVNLKGWHIGVSDDITDAWTFSNSMCIYAHDYLLVYCDKKNDKYQHTSFRLDSGKGTIYLWNSEGLLVDSLSHPKQKAPNIAYGRTTNGGEEWDFEVQPTPGQAQAGVFTSQMLPDPTFSEAGWVNAGTPTSTSLLTISFPSDSIALPADTRLYVTTDGSSPTSASPSYGPAEPCVIRLDTTIVVRARLLSAEALPALPVTHSYIRHPRATTLPIFSFSTNGEYLYDSEIGMLLGTDYSGNCYKGWRRPFNIEYFDPGDYTDAQINQVGEAGMHGAGSLSHKQKAMNIYTNKRWQKKRFKCSNFWPDKPNITKTKTFCVRNGGSRCLDSRFEDAFVQLLFARHVDSLQYLSYSPCLVYINGQYRGLYGLRERANNTWAENNLGIDEDSITEVESFIDKGEAYSPVMELMDDEQSTLAQYAQYLDIPLLLDYLCCEAFGTNTLFPGSNVFMWRAECGEDQRLHPLLKDLDDLADTAASTNWYNFVTATGKEAEWGDIKSKRLFARLFALPDFCNAFLDRMQVYLGDFCKPSVTVPMVNAMRAEIDSEVAATFAAIDEGAEYSDFANRIDKLLIPYCKNRPAIHYQHLSERFNLGKVVALKVQNHTSTSTVRINDIALTEGNFDGACFAQRVTKLDSNHPDYIWSCIETFADGHTRSWLQESQVYYYWPSGEEVASAQFRLVRRPSSPESVVIVFGDEGTMCTAHPASDGVQVQIEGTHVNVTSTSDSCFNYILTGEANGGTFSINSKNPWQLTLDGLTLDCGQESAISVKSAARGTIVLADGSANTLIHTADEADRKSPVGCIRSVGSLELKGAGSLLIETNGRSAINIAVGGKLTFEDGTYTLVNASVGQKEHGAIYSGMVIHTAGDLVMRNGTFKIISSGNATKDFIIGGELTLGDPDDLAAGPDLHFTNRGQTVYTSSDYGTLTSACPCMEAQGSVNVWGNTRLYATAISNGSNAIKSYTSVNIHGGNLYMNCFDDCINSPGPITFAGGNTVCFSTDDDAIDSDYPNPGAIVLSGGNLFAYTLAQPTEEGIDCDDDQRIFIQGGIVVSAGGAQDPNSRLTGGSTQGYYLGPGIANPDAQYYYSLCGSDGEVICTYHFEQSFTNLLSLITAPNLGHDAFTIRYGIDPPSDYEQSVNDCFYIGGKTTNMMTLNFDVCNTNQKTMALLGASTTVRPESHVCKDYWTEQLDLEVRDYGIGGAGFSNTVQTPGVQEAVDDLCVAQRPPYDIYLIWAPSNDFKREATIGKITDYTAADGYDNSKRSTVYGGMNYVLRKIRTHNPEARIVLFTTIPRFDCGTLGYDVNATASNSLRRYVDAQIAWAEANGIPYLDTFRQCGINGSNYQNYTVSDNIHLNEAGYALLKVMTAEFLRNQLDYSHIEDIVGEALETDHAIYSIGGLRIAKPAQGLYIQNKKIMFVR